jgi:hypothetical protein
MIEVNDPKQTDGVSVNHPSLVSTAKNLAKINADKPPEMIRQEIVKRTGLPAEVAEKLEREARKGKK